MFIITVWMRTPELQGVFKLLEYRGRGLDAYRADLRNLGMVIAANYPNYVLVCGSPYVGDAWRGVERGLFIETWWDVRPMVDSAGVREVQYAIHRCSIDRWTGRVFDVACNRVRGWSEMIRVLRIMTEYAWRVVGAQRIVYAVFNALDVGRGCRWVSYIWVEQVHSV